MPGTEQKSVTYDFNSKQALMMLAEDLALYSEKEKTINYREVYGRFNNFYFVIIQNP